MAVDSNSPTQADPGVNVPAPPVRSKSGVSITSEGFTRSQKQLIDSAERKMAGRFLFGVFVTIFINYIDRTNLAFASVQLNADIGLSPSVYGLGSGLFFISYACK
jgi:sugar phosphate permease